MASPSGDTYSFSIGCPVCAEVVVFSSTRDEIRGRSPITASGTYCGYSWTLCADEKEYFWRQLNFLLTETE